MTERTCGTCDACCVWLGITELQKHMGQTCRHLSGANPEARCTIYERRPAACATYKCFWRVGHFSERFRPDKTGVIITPYVTGFSLLVFDETKAGDIEQPDSPLGTILSGLLTEEILPEIRILYPRAKRVLILREGKIYLGKLLPQKGFEDLQFETDGVPVGTYLKTNQEIEL